MKKITLFSTAVAALAVAVSMSGCSKENNGLPEGEKCRLSLTGTTIDLSGGAQSSMTKTETETLAEGLGIGVHIVDLTSQEAIVTAKLANLQHITDASGGIVNNDPTHNPIILTTGYVYDIYAYSPYVAEVTAASAATIPVAHGVDLLWAKAAGEKPNAATHNAALTFQRKAAQVSFKIVADPKSAPDITGATLGVTGFYKDGTMDLGTGKMTVGAVDNTIQFTDQTKPVCFLPAEGQMALNVTVTIPAGPNAGTYLGVETDVFAPGTSTLITITVVDRNSELGLTGGVAPWVDDIGDVDVNN